MKIQTTLCVTLAISILAGCATAPTGPSVMALPGSGKSFEQFRFDDANCRQYAQSQTNPDAANNSALRSAAVGTAIGAVAGAALGGREGAAFGAGGGLLVGSAAGAGNAENSAYGTQRQYDNAYTQCMYAKGQRVPVSGMPSQQRYQQQTINTPPAPGPNYPPPPDWQQR
ncbi:MAG TPA: YMGG-like glycine zipper-containing protein [Rhodocyclaceae bacterium]|nr:YMGG-like glycine zipper-containing protein [Rhodocyclaceae bacterium]